MIAGVSHALPAPPELLEGLLLGTFVLHLAALGLLVAGLAARVRAEWTHDPGDRIEFLHRTGVLGFSMTITTGVAPLLFVQVLYGVRFYSSSITIGYPWLAVIAYLLVGFYSLYLWRWRWERCGGPSASGKFFLILTLLSVFAIGFTFSWNHLLSLSATPWAEKIRHPVVMARVAGYMGAVFIIAAAWLFWLRERLRSDCEHDRLASTTALVGAVLLIVWSLTSQFAASTWGSSARLLIGIGGATAIIAALAGIFARFGSARWMATFAGLAAPVGMAVQRESSRLATFGVEYAGSRAVEAQWGAMVMFALFLVAGLLTLWWMMRKIRAIGHSTPT